MAGGGGAGELNLVPFMDILTTLLVFTLAVGTIGLELAAPPVDVPPLGPGTGAEERLTVNIGADGFTLSGGGAMRIAREGEAWPYARLTSVLRELRDAGDTSSGIQLTASREIPYSIVIATMDAVRSDAEGPLYPKVSLGVLAPG